MSDSALDAMRRGDPYRADDPTVVAAYRRGQALVARFNAATHDADEERLELLRELCEEVGDGVEVRPPLRAEYGHVRIGDGTFVNVDCVLLDGAPITIGAHCQLGPRVQLVTATHPVDADERRSGVESARAITLGDDVWLGAGVIVCPGVTIGAGTVVGAGSVVTRDLPPGVVAVGSPARVVSATGDPANRPTG